MISITPRARRRACGVVLAGFLLGAVGCSSTDGSPPATTLVSIATTSSTAVAATTASTTPSTVPTIAVVDPNAALQQGLAALAAGYHFSSSVSVNGTQSLLAEGDRIGDASRLLLTGDGGTVQYIIIPDGSYAQPEGGEWSLLDVPPATSDPIVALQSPVSAITLPTADGSVAVRATVTAVSLGITADGNVDVDVLLVNGTIAQITYATAVEGGTAQVVTTISPVADPTPITAPI
ncbi:MAG: hypothetical protein WCC60_17155 [Ilumatobacteraceae bacterium]